jgi:hypothetical protein
MSESSTRIPFGSLIAVRWDSSGIFDHSGEVHQIPRHERGVSIREIVLGSSRTFIEI